MLFKADLELRCDRAGSFQKFILWRGIRILKLRYIQAAWSRLQLAERLLDFAEASVREFSDEPIYVDDGCRSIVHLPAVLTREFFAKKETRQ